MNKPLFTIVRTALLGLCLLTGSLMASPLSDARDAGQVEELPSGFVAATDKATAEVRAMVEEVNQRRREAYEEIARRNNLTVEQVGQESFLKRYPQ